jgi:hypothetical protein
LGDVKILTIELINGTRKSAACFAKLFRIDSCSLTFLSSIIFQKQFNSAELEINIFN